MSSIEEEALHFVKTNKKIIKEKFAGDAVCKSTEKPISIFMAGSPGAGKTELSKWFLKVTGVESVRIDADEIRDFIPLYNKKNATEMQRAAALGVEYLYDYALDKKKNLILDATFADFEKSRKNIERSIRKKREIEIFYIQQDPKIAWEFTKAREKLEGRPVPKDIFIHSFLEAPKNVDLVKAEFGESINIHIVERNFEQNMLNFRKNVDKLELHLHYNYTKESLMKIL